MATVILAWELGGGLGHLINLLPIAQGLQQRRHRIFAVARDVGKAEYVFRELDVAYLQAPIKSSTSSVVVQQQRSFPHILRNHGFDEASELRALASAWRNVFELVGPDLIVFDHSPTALLAAKGLPVKKATIGTGFFCPFDEYPMTDLRPWLPQAADKLRQDEDHVLTNANAVLASWNQPPLERLSRLFYDVDEHFLATLPELDHYPSRVGALTGGSSVANTQKEVRYWGVWPNVGGRPPRWPERHGKRVFAYLKPFPALPRLLQQLYDLRQPTIVHGDGLGQEIHKRFASDTMTFESEHVDLAEVGRTCDLAILNGNHGTTVSMLLAGKPTLQVPIALEQGLFSQVVERLGAGILAAPDRPLDVVAGLMQMLGSDKYTEAAKRFAVKYVDYDPQRQIAAVVDRAEQLLHGG